MTNSPSSIEPLSCSTVSSLGYSIYQTRPRSVRPTSPEPLMSGCGFVLQHWPDDLDHSLAARQNLTTGKVEGRVLGIISGQLQQPSLRERVDDPADARPIDGPGTHHAGFGTCVQRR